MRKQRLHRLHTQVKHACRDKDVFLFLFIIEIFAHRKIVSHESGDEFELTLRLRHVSRVDAFGFRSEVFIVPLMRPQQRRFLAVESRNLWSYNSSAELPSSAGPQETHTHTHIHACIHTCFFFFVTHSVFSRSLSLPPSSSCMRFPDVFSVSSLCQCSQQIKAATARRASSFWTLWPLTCLMFEDVKVEGHRAVRATAHFSI